MAALLPYIDLVGLETAFNTEHGKVTLWVNALEGESTRGCAAGV